MDGNGKSGTWILLAVVALSLQLVSVIIKFQRIKNYHSKKEYTHKVVPAQEEVNDYEATANLLRKIIQTSFMNYSVEGLPARYRSEKIIAIFDEANDPFSPSQALSTFLTIENEIEVLSTGSLGPKQRFPQDAIAKKAASDMFTEAKRIVAYMKPLELNFYSNREEHEHRFYVKTNEGKFYILDINPIDREALSESEQLILKHLEVIYKEFRK